MTAGAAGVQCNRGRRGALRRHPTFDRRSFMQRTLLTLALIATAGVSYAQQPMTSAEPTDPYGRPLIGRNDPGPSAR